MFNFNQPENLDKGESPLNTCGLFDIPFKYTIPENYQKEFDNPFLYCDFKNFNQEDFGYFNYQKKELFDMLEKPLEEIQHRDFMVAIVSFIQTLFSKNTLATHWKFKGKYPEKNKLQALAYLKHEILIAFWETIYNKYFDSTIIKNPEYQSVSDMSKEKLYEKTNQFINLLKNKNLI